MRYRASRYLSAVINALPRFALLARLFPRPWGDITQKLRELNEVALAWRSLAPSEPDLALRLRRAKAQQADVAAGMDLARDRHLRQECDAVAIGNHLHDGGEARRAEAVAGPR